jgi:protein phosphatase 1L
MFSGRRGDKSFENLSLMLPFSTLRASSPQANPGQVLAAALEQLEAEVIGMASVTSGSTALAGCIVGSHMWLANLGDCRAVSCEEGGIVKRLTADQVCGLDSERAAIEARGGRVENGRVNGKIEVSRTLGDRGLKPPLGCTPEVTVHDCSSMQWALAASDGLWEVVTDDEAMGVIKDTVKTPDLLAKRIVMHAIDPRGSMDNISCIVFVFGDLCGACERIF